MTDPMSLSLNRLIDKEALGTLPLLEHPEQLARVRDTDDPEVIASAVEELLRHLSVVHLGRRRTALEDIDIAGRTIRAGEGVILLGRTGQPGSGRLPRPGPAGHRPRR